MTVCIRAALVTALLPIAGAAWGADQIEQEPQHQLKFQNQHVRLFDVLLPHRSTSSTLAMSRSTRSTSL